MKRSLSRAVKRYPSDVRTDFLGDLVRLKGVTLIELLITMVLCVALSITALASYSYLVQKNERQTLIDELQSAIQYAKIQSIVLGAPVWLSPLDNSLDWSKGIVLTALNKKTKQNDLIYQWQWDHPHWSVHWQGLSSPDKISFSNNPVQAISNGHFTLMNNHTREQTIVILNRLGRIKVSQDIQVTNAISNIL